MPASLARYIARSAQRTRSAEVDGVVGEDRDPDRRADLGPDRVERERLLDLGRQPSGHRGRVVGVGVEQRHRELVAAEADDQIGAPQRVLEPGAELAQELVPGGVPEGVVDLLEAVEVEEHERDAARVGVAVGVLGGDARRAARTASGGCRGRSAGR